MGDDVLQATATESGIVCGAAAVTRAALHVPTMALVDVQGEPSFEGAEDKEQVAIFGKRTLRGFSPKTSTQVEEVCYWIATWFQALLIALVAAVVIIACQVAFGAIGKLVAVVGTFVIRIARIVGLI